MIGVKTSVNIAGIDEALDDWERQIEEAARPAAQAGAELLYRAVLQNVAALGHHTGNLYNAIYQVHSDRSGNGSEIYDVSWNAKKAPHGHLVEDGYIQRFRAYVGKDGKWHTDRRHPLANPKQIPAKAFVRRAASRLDDAGAAMEAALLGTFR